MFNISYNRNNFHSLFGENPFWTRTVDETDPLWLGYGKTLVYLDNENPIPIFDFGVSSFALRLHSQANWKAWVRRAKHFLGSYSNPFDPDNEAFIAIYLNDVIYIPLTRPFSWGLENYSSKNVQFSWSLWEIDHEEEERNLTFMGQGIDSDSSNPSQIIEPLERTWGGSTWTEGVNLLSQEVKRSTVPPGKGRYFLGPANPFPLHLYPVSGWTVKEKTGFRAFFGETLYQRRVVTETWPGIQPANDEEWPDFLTKPRHHAYEWGDVFTKDGESWHGDVFTEIAPQGTSESQQWHYWMSHGQLDPWCRASPLPQGSSSFTPPPSEEVEYPDCEEFWEVVSDSLVIWRRVFSYGGQTATNELRIELFESGDDFDLHTQNRWNSGILHGLGNTQLGKNAFVVGSGVSFIELTQPFQLRIFRDNSVVHGKQQYEPIHGTVEFRYALTVVDYVERKIETSEKTDTISVEGLQWPNNFAQVWDLPAPPQKAGTVVLLSNIRWGDFQGDQAYYSAPLVI